MNASVDCVCCGGPVRETGHTDQFSGAPLVSCRRCAHVQASVPPSGEAIACYYAGRYSAERSRAADAAYHAVMDRRAEAQCRFLVRAGLSLSGLRACDVGCGYGALIQALRRRGADADGLEFDPACVTHCLESGLSVRRISSEEEIGIIADRDLVTLSHTLEHVRHAEAFLERLRGRTRYVFIEVPNYSLRLPEQFRNQEGHIHFFNRLSLGRLLERVGLHPVAASACGPGLWFFWSDLCAPARRIARRLRRDWFFGDYAREHRGGMWTRALARFEGESPAR